MEKGKLQSEVYKMMQNVEERGIQLEEELYKLPFADEVIETLIFDVTHYMGLTIGVTKINMRSVTRDISDGTDLLQEKLGPIEMAKTKITVSINNLLANEKYEGHTETLKMVKELEEGVVVLVPKLN